jgi:very-short-patch-repair endonuclease
MTVTTDAMAALAGLPFGLFTRERAMAAGLTEDDLRRLVGRGFLVPKGRQVFASPLTPGSHLTDLAALMLDVGGPVWAYGPTSAALLDYDGFVLAPPFHLLIERGRFVRRPGHVIHTSEHMNGIDRRTIRGLHTAAGARTLLALAAMPAISDELLTTALDSAIRDLHITDDHLHRRIAALRGRGRHGVTRLLAVLEGAELTRGGHSWLEREFLRLVGAAGLPRPETQVVLGRAGTSLIRVDCHFPRTPVVVEVLGYRWHRTPSQTSRDAERFNRMTLDGFEPFQFTYHHIVSTPSAVVATVREALSRHRPADPGTVSRG